MIIDGTARVALTAVFGIWLLQMTGCVTPQEVAQTSLDDLHKLNVPAKNADDEAFVKDIGFNSLEEVADAQLGSPLHLYNVPLVQLQQFQHGDDPNNLLADTGRVIFPLTVKGRFKSSLTVVESSLSVKGWKGSRVTRKGFPRLIGEIEKLKTSSSSFIVSIVPLGLVFLGDHKAGRLVMTVIDENPYLELKAGDEYDAAEIFGKIVPYAKHRFESDRHIRRNP
jgi:hypothetical protein